ncbi:DGQHR domain-containing protein [Ferrovum myxofaciens]|uniref:DGQHR domain-containing protein n=1 Tax=Ferrovum myxofaciens TaxID=416213 RepID=A0A9E6SYN2_9PROT|nr:DGQHR domain-containing protein [Ferrovum myxofaciens]QKE37680.1 MAG: DGQHR domain-containing protein [Ferrovum myxofaciens]QWY75341.1 MAG: DGQHR domain-containing protein [Ferrovum myxofaciens]QWY78081.1 MAG: DGQHR domain-containing protein [Ferrovum myxofaciens]
MVNEFSKNYNGIILKQRNNYECPLIFICAIPAKDIKEWVDVIPTREKKGAIQRILSDAHVRSIKNYISASPKNIIPTTITIAIPSEYEVIDHSLGDQCSLKTLKITMVEGQKSKPALLIDGQHRLEAMTRVEEEIPLICTIILGANDLERAINFVVINNKAKRVPTDLVKAIVSELDEVEKEDFKTRVTSIGLSLGDYNNALIILSLSDTSPFNGLLDWETNRDGQRLIKPLALEMALRLVRNDLNTESELDVDESLEILSAMWRGIKKAPGYDNIWLNNDSNLLSKASLVATTEFLIERINQKIEDGEIDPTEIQGVEQYSTELMSKIPSEFWTTKWEVKSLDTSAGRGLIRDALSKIRTNISRGMAEPFNKIDLFTPPSSEEQ